MNSFLPGSPARRPTTLLEQGPGAAPRGGRRRRGRPGPMAVGALVVEAAGQPGDRRGRRGGRRRCGCGRSGAGSRRCGGSRRPRAGRRAPRGRAGPRGGGRRGRPRGSAGRSRGTRGAWTSWRYWTRNSMSARPPEPRFRSVRACGRPRASGASRRPRGPAPPGRPARRGPRGSPSATSRPKPPVEKITRARVRARRSQGCAELAEVVAEGRRASRPAGPTPRAAGAGCRPRRAGRSSTSRPSAFRTRRTTSVTNCSLGIARARPRVCPSSSWRKTRSRSL